MILRGKPNTPAKSVEMLSAAPVGKPRVSTGTSSHSFSKKVPFEHGSGKRRETVPAKPSATGKHSELCFNSKTETVKFIANTLGEREEHGKQAVSSEERRLIWEAENELGRLEKLRASWSPKNSRGIREISTLDATEQFSV